MKKIIANIYGQNFKGVPKRYCHMNFVSELTPIIHFDRRIKKRVSATIWFEYEFEGITTGSYIQIPLFGGPIRPNDWFEIDYEDNSFIAGYLNLKNLLLSRKRSEEEIKETEKLIRKFEKKLTLENRLRLEVYDG